MKMGCKNLNIFREKFTNKDYCSKYNFDWILEQQQRKDIYGKTVETQIESIV